VPIWFQWDGRQIVIGTPARAPKAAALKQNPKVALTIDTNDFPYHVLMMRGSVAIELMDRIPDEYALMARRSLGPGADDGWRMSPPCCQPWGVWRGWPSRPNEYGCDKTGAW
jgi:hypothetical protein